MLGEKVGEESGRITGQRVLPSDGVAPKVESSFQDTGKLLGVDFTDMGTYFAVVQPDGTLHGEGQGVLMGRDGEMGSWVGQGVGTFKGGGAISYRGAVYVQSASPKWARLNSVALLYEYEIDGNGNTKGQWWEWK